MAGSKFKLEMMEENYKLKWEIHEAKILDNSQPRHDIGMIFLRKNDKPFFNTKDLSNPDQLRTAKIVPICLGKTNINVQDKQFRGVGWGRIYHEAPKHNPRNPTYSSCMKSEASEEGWKFQNCNMKIIKQANWNCENTMPPPSYYMKAGQEKRCKDLFEKSKSHKDPLDPQQTIAERFKKITLDKLYIVDERNNHKETCYNPELLSNHGWCYLADYPEQHEDPNSSVRGWGICSPSCNHEVMQVSKNIGKLINKNIEIKMPF